MVLPLLMAGALIASSAIMVAPYANEELKKQTQAAEVVTQPAVLREQHQSVRLLEEANSGLLYPNPNYPTKKITGASWFYPMIFATGAFVLFLVTRR
tara:strand:+ start:637 stop:927 length:291 start_codon:yes stop_codon:yes gene_type:complete